MGAKHFGARVTRFEDPALLTGRGRFVDDMALPRRSRPASCAARTAMPASARSTRRRRCAMPGVHAVLTADDLPEPMRTERIPKLMPNPAIRTMRTQHCAGARRGLLRRPDDRRGDRRQPLPRRGRRGRWSRSTTTSLPAVERLPRRGEARRAARAHRSRRQHRGRRADELRRRRRRVRATRAHVFEEEHLDCTAAAAWRWRRRAVLASHDAGERHAHGLVGDADAASRPRHARRPARAQSRIASA